MQEYLIFFGKSQAFTFYAFNDQDFVADFGSVIPDFDLLESRLFNIDAPDVKPVLAKYKFKVGNTNFSLLKLYSYAQAAAGNRVEGSIYGVAFLSGNDITVSASNISILSSLKNYFSEMVLTNQKFNKENFQEEARAIWFAFKNQFGFSTFQSQPGIHLMPSNAVTAFGVNSLQDIPKLTEQQQFQANKIYFSEDKTYFERVKKKWNTNIELFVENDKQQLIGYNEQVSKPDPVVVGDANSIQISDLKDERNRLKKQVQRLKQKVKYLKIVLIFLLIGLIGITTMYMLAGPAKQVPNNRITEVKTNPGNTQPDFNRQLLDSVIVDSIRFKRTLFFLEDVKRYRSKKNESDKKLAMAAAFKSGRMLLIDSAILRERLK